MIFRGPTNAQIPGLMPQFRRGYATGGGGGFVPTDIAGCLLWLPADQITGLSNGDPVASWPDQSGNGNDATGSAQPTYQTGQLNGLPVVRFFANQLVSLFAISDRTIFVVNKQTADGGDAILDDATSSAGFYVFRQGTSGVSFGIYNGLQISANISSPSSWANLALSTDSLGNTVTLYQDGSSIASGSIAFVGPFGANGLSIGARASNSANWAGDIAEIIAYDSILSAPNFSAVNSYLQSKYAL